MKAVSAVTANRSAGRGRACQVKEDAGIRPFLQPRKARHEDGNGPEHFPKSQDAEEVHWVAKQGNYAMGFAQKLSDLRSPTASDKKRYEYGRCPISNRFSFS